MLKRIALVLALVMATPAFASVWVAYKAPNPTPSVWVSYTGFKLPWIKAN